MYGDTLVTRQIEIVGKELLLGIISFNSRLKSPQAEVNYSVVVYILSLMIMLKLRVCSAHAYVKDKIPRAQTKLLLYKIELKGFRATIFGSASGAR